VDRRFFKNLDYTMITVVLILIAIGLVMVFSATHNNDRLTGGDPYSFVKKQAVAVGIGALIFIIILFGDYRLSDRMSYALYIMNIVMLILVLVLGDERNGSKSWLFGIQPSEFAKVITIVVFAKFLAERNSLTSFFDFIWPFCYIGLPMILILMQPDFGTTLVFIFFMLIMMYMAGAPGLKIMAIIGTAVLLITLLFVSHNLFNTPLPVKDYQVARLTSFLNPENDPQGSSWNLRQAIIAVGSGQFFGKGITKGTQGRLGYLPEHHTDFIFAILCEELGFIGGFGVLFLFFTLIWRGIRIAYQAKDKVGCLTAAGLVSMFLFHILENVGMNIGIMPITGIPLPFISSGGSSMIANMASIAILINIWARRQKIMF